MAEKVTEIKRRQEKLALLLQRIEAGEDEKLIQDTYMEQMSNLTLHEIAVAEQGLLSEGISSEQVEQLKKLHPLILDGREEEAVWQQENEQIEADRARAFELADVAFSTPGHPLSVLRAENEALLKVTKQTRQLLEEQASFSLFMECFNRLEALKSHYGKKDELIMPLLEEYGVFGPTQVMWTREDEIRHGLGILRRKLKEETYAGARDDIEKLLGQVEMMATTEEKVLLPTSMQYFTEGEWYEIYCDLDSFGLCLIETYPKWDEGESYREQKQKKQAEKMDNLKEGVVYFEGGQLTIQQLKAVMKRMPFEITFVDENDINRLFLNASSQFARPMSALDREVYVCHPPRLVQLVRDMIADFKAHKKDHVERWIPNKEDPVRILYLAVYDEDGTYMGVLELIQHFGEYADKLRNILS
ncbi:MAG: DUF438 domain-containing protein [Eubacterium sp.]|nr:DUF438 domain-containing protein [Eubacterium sp.]